MAQETRSMMFGRVLDPQGAAIVGATVVVTNLEMNVSQSFTTNDSGYYEANLLLPGNYQLTAEMAGFKKLVRKGVVLPVASRIEVDLPLEVGALAETISVTAEAPLLETNAVSTGRVIDNRTIMDLPTMSNSAMLLVKLTPGIQTGGVNNYLGLHSIVGGSEYNMAGNVGGNFWSIDGVPNAGSNRRAAFLPYTDAIAEFKVELTNFDAGIGQTSGATISMISKSGSNALHGTYTWQHWQQRWQGSPFFLKQQYYRRIADAEARGNTALANELRNTDKQAAGRSNNWAATIGGPVVLPKIINGRNKLFFFFTYNGFKDVKTEDAANINRTVPTERDRAGDFGYLLQTRNGSPRYIIHDPLTIRRDPARPNNFIRTAFPNNVIPRARWVNPAADRYSKFYPNANNNPSDPLLEPVNNYLATQTPYNWDYYAYASRVDYQVNDKQRIFGRWSINDFVEDRGDWVYETQRGLNTNGLNRNNKGGTVDYVFTQSARTFWNFAVALNQFREGDRITVPFQFKPTDLGLPAYLDAKAAQAGQNILPQMTMDGYSSVGRGGVPVFTRSRILTAKAEFAHMRGKHSLRAAVDIRNQFRTGGGGGNTSGNFSFTNFYTRRNDDTAVTPAGNLGHSYAAFLLGIPSGVTIATNDNFAIHSPYYAWYVQDNWRLTSKLTLNLGLRLEYEMGSTERYNRMIGNFDPNLDLPIAAAAQAAYARSPIPELPASQFRIRGGSYYPGVDGRPRRLFRNELMWLPRIGAAYQLNSKTVIRAGAGSFFDTINVLNFGADQFGFSRTTSTVVSTDFGQTFNFPAGANPYNGGSPLLDPFPVRADGTRFDIPTREGLGAMARVGRGFGYTDFSQRHARQQRWTLGLQRQLGGSNVLTATYQGTYADRVPLSINNSFLPEQYWADGLVRREDIANNLNQNVNNPFRITNFESMRQSHPLIYQDMTTLGFYTAAITRKSQLLRQFPHLATLSNNRTNLGTAISHEFQVNLERRFSKGFNFNVGYTRLHLKEADFFHNEWDRKPTKRPTNDGRPHRLVATGIWEFPFGKSRAWLNKGGLTEYLAGGWQIGSTYECQPGALLGWGNLFYYGSDLSAIGDVDRTFDRWFNTANFETNPTRTASSFHRRVFPTRINGLRQDMTNQWNANVAKNMKFAERVTLQLRLEALNLLNRSQMAAPVLDPVSTNFGRIVSQTSATNRWVQVQARLSF